MRLNVAKKKKKLGQKQSQTIMFFQPHYLLSLVQKIFFARYCYHVVISQSVCHLHSLLPLYSDICEKVWSLPEWSLLRDSTLIVGSQPCPQILVQGGSDRKWQTLQLISIGQQLRPKKLDSNPQSHDQQSSALPLCLSQPSKLKRF